MDDIDLSNAILFAEDRRGIYIPQHFAEAVHRDMVTGVTDEQWAILEAGPDHEHYWEVWDEVTRDAVITDRSGQRWTLWQDGDLWLLPETA